MNIAVAATTPPAGPAAAMHPLPPQRPADAYAGSVLTEPQPHKAWGVPIVAGATVGSACFGALSGLLVSSMGAAGGIPTALAAGVLLGGGALAAIAASGGHNNKKQVMRAAALGAASGAGAALVGSLAAVFSSHPIIAGTVAAAAAGLAVSGYIAWAD